MVFLGKPKENYGEEEVQTEEGEAQHWLAGGKIDVMIEAREREDGKRPSLIDLDAYKEMLELHEYILNITVEPPA